MSQGDDTRVKCSDGCGRTVTDEDEALSHGWCYLCIQKRWRCPQCDRELAAVNRKERSDEK